VVGIENNTSWSFKDLEEMLRSVKTLKRNNEESSGILIGASMAKSNAPSRRLRQASNHPYTCFGSAVQEFGFLRYSATWKLYLRPTVPLPKVTSTCLVSLNA
jgi:hypothetical protein